MESLLGFKEVMATTDDNSRGYKLVPWLSWEEWDSVRVSLFSSSPDSVAFALRRIEAWESRGCLPVPIEATYLLIKIQGGDPYFRIGINNEWSKTALFLSYTMAIVRLVSVVEKTCEKTNISIAEAAAAIDMPRMLVDIRHEASHQGFSSLELLRRASTKALIWLKSYYWDPQQKAIPFQRGESGNIKKEVKSRLRELVLSLKMKQSSKTDFSQLKVKRGKHFEKLCGRNKFISLAATKVRSPKYLGSTKQIARILKNLVRLYSCFSSEMVSVLLEVLLKESNTSYTVESADKFQVRLGLDAAQIVFDEWKPVVVKLSEKEPEVLLNLLKAVLDIIEARKAAKVDLGGEEFSMLYNDEVQRIRVLSSLFLWLVELLNGLKLLQPEGSGTGNTDSSAPLKAALNELVRRCVLVSDPRIHELMRSSLLITQMIGSSYLHEKLVKFSNVLSSSLNFTEEYSSDLATENLENQDKDIQQAIAKLELLKSCRMRSMSESRLRKSDMETGSRWTVVKSWKPCPIGMLPRIVGSSGYLPNLDCTSQTKVDLKTAESEEDTRFRFRHWDTKEDSCAIEPLNEPSIENLREDIDVCDTDDHFEDVTPSDGMHCDKREDSCVIGTLNEPSTESLREDIDVCDTNDHFEDVTRSVGMQGRLLIGGVWRKVGEQTLRDIQSEVRILKLSQ